jgi:hypothetical protein
MAAEQVVIKRGILDKSTDGPFAFVYIDGSEYRVYAPAGATGPARDWLKQSAVRQLNGLDCETAINDGKGLRSLQLWKTNYIGGTFAGKTAYTRMESIAPRRSVPVAMFNTATGAGFK